MGTLFDDLMGAAHEVLEDTFAETVLHLLGGEQATITNAIIDRGELKGSFRVDPETDGLMITATIRVPSSVTLIPRQSMIAAGEERFSVVKWLSTEGGRRTYGLSRAAHAVARRIE